MAGFEAKELHWNPRTVCVVPDGLRKRVFPWLDDEIEKVKLAAMFDGNDRATAGSTLRLWDRLRDVLLQDAATIVLKHPDRMKHIVFRDDVFRDPMFLVS